MKEFQFTIEINASKEIVWKTLWDDATFRIWAAVIDEGTYMKGAMIEGNEIEFISSVNGYGVTSLIEKLTPNEFILFRHSADTIENGQQEREKEWTGSKESYSLSEKDGHTKLTVKTDVPQELEQIFSIRLPKALEQIKALSEKNNESNVLEKGPFFHGTKAELKIGDLLKPQQRSNYQDKESNYIYFTATLDAAKWGSELASSNSTERIYIVEPTGDFENDPNLTDKRFPGNPTRSYRSKFSLKIIAELGTWERHSDEEINHMLTSLKKLRDQGKAIIYD
jgi:rifampin ADP-ribosylating transferase